MCGQMDDGDRTVTLPEYMKLRGGTRVISKILIANNGIAALKAIRSIKKWSYEVFGRSLPAPLSSLSLSLSALQGRAQGMCEYELNVI